MEADQQGADEDPADLSRIEPPEELTGITSEPPEEQQRGPGRAAQ